MSPFARVSKGSKKKLIGRDKCTQIGVLNTLIYCRF